MTNCYAESLGGCNSISAEHIVSKSLFGPGAVFTIGLPIPNFKPIGIESLVANILCEAHNSQLSPLDAAVGILGEACAAFTKTQQSATVYVDGPLIQRWLLKLAVGTTASGWLGGVKVTPHPTLVRCLFGLLAFPPSVGMFGVAQVGKHITSNQLVSCHIFLGKSPGSLGLFASIHGLPLFLSLTLDDPEKELRALGVIAGYNVSQASLKYHPPEIVMRPDNGPAKLSIQFSWP